MYSSCSMGINASYSGEPSCIQACISIEFLYFFVIEHILLPIWSYRERETFVNSFTALCFLRNEIVDAFDPLLSVKEKLHNVY